MPPFAFALMLAIAPAGGEDCAVTEVETMAQVGLTYSEFDGRAGRAGWRQLIARGCADEAVTLLQRYRAVNHDRFTAAQRQEVAFHIGQAYALAGRDAEALLAFELALGADLTAEWRSYVEATLAFLRRDRAALARARAAYAAAPGADPMRLKVIEGFLACPDRPYMEAAHCAM